LAFIYALLEALSLRVKNLTIKSDSQLLIKQLRGEFRVRDKNIKLFFDLATHLIERFKNINLVQIDRGQNTEADRLATGAIKDFLKSKEKKHKKRAGRTVASNEKLLF